VVGEPEQLETGARHGVSRHDSPPARGREHGDARAPREWLGRERRCRLESLFERDWTGRTGLMAHAVEDPLVGRQRARMRGRGPLTSGGYAALEEDERFAAGDAADPLEETSTVGYSFDVRE